MASGLPDFRSPVDIAASAILEASVTIASQVGNLDVNLADQVGNIAVNIADQVGNLSVSLAEAIAEMDVNIANQVSNIAVSIADQVGNVATDITAQTLAALNTDYRYGTAGDSQGSQAINSASITLISLSGKGVIFGGAWIIDRDEVGVAPGLANTIKYEIDGEDHLFFPLSDAVDNGWADPRGYQPSVTKKSADDHKAAGYLPGPITFETSFKVIVTSSDTSGDDEIDARVYYAIALD